MLMSVCSFDNRWLSIRPTHRDSFQIWNSPNCWIRRFNNPEICQHDSNLVSAINEAHERHSALIEEVGAATLMLEESNLIEKLREDFVNFYKPETVNPYIPIAARGPWIITAHGRVIHDNGGYGMLGAGHGPQEIIEAMSDNWVMANVMTRRLVRKGWLTL